MKQIYKRVFISLLIIIPVCVGSISLSTKAQANNSDVCDQGEHVYNPHCITVIPTVKPSCTPTQEITPTVSETPATVSATPTVQPGDQETPIGGPGDGRSDGLSDGRSDGRSSTPQVSVPKAPAAGRAEQ